MNDRGHDFIGGYPDQAGVIAWWNVGRLWRLAADLPVQTTSLETFAHVLDGFNLLAGRAYSNRELALEAKRIFDADLSFPIILSADGWVMDGYHRLCKACALGLPEIKTVQFAVDPEPDKRQTKAQSAALGNVVY